MELINDVVFTIDIVMSFFKIKGMKKPTLKETSFAYLT